MNKFLFRSRMSKLHAFRLKWLEPDIFVRIGSKHRRKKCKTCRTNAIIKHMLAFRAAGRLNLALTAGRVKTNSWQ